MSCREHNRDLRVFCRTDQSVVCALCATMEHQGHTLGLVSEERRITQEKLRDKLTKSKGILQNHKQRCRNKKRIIEQIQEQAKEADDFCEGVLVRVIHSLQNHYCSVRKMIRAREEAAIAEVDVSIQRLQLRMERMRKWEAELDLLTQIESDVDFLQKWATLKCQPEPDQDFQHDAVDPGLLFEPIKTTLEELGRQLEELTPIPLPDDGEDESEEETDEDEDEQQMDDEGSAGFDRQILSVEPVTRAEFLQYACRLIFDPATAHQGLVVSTDKREVSLCGGTVESPSIRRPHRFVHRKQLLCRAPLLADWSYYEVEVEGSKAEIALAYAVMDRKSRTTLSAFGGNPHSWSLDRSAFYSVSHKAESVQLTTAPCHPRIGVFVKFGEGVVSFYEVAETMVFLYKVQAEFTELLYPGFWLGEKCRISICDLDQ